MPQSIMGMMEPHLDEVCNMSTLPTSNGAELVNYPDQLRELIPHYLRAGILRRVALPDGGIQFVEAQTDQVFITLDGQGRFVI